MSEKVFAETEALTISNIGKKFGGLEVLKSVSFSVKKGERRAIIGPNGAGKTTLFNMIAGDIQPSNGEIFSFGKNITKTPNYRKVHDGIVRTFQKNNLLNELSVLENVLVVLQPRYGVQNIWFKSRSPKNFPEMYAEAHELLETWGLSDRKHSIVKNLSYGEQRQVEIILGIATKPVILLLDEPTAGMSNTETQHILGLLKEMPRDLTMLIIEHDMDVVFGLADKIAVLHNGEVFAEGDPESIGKDPRIHQIYFGEEEIS